MDRIDRLSLKVNVRQGIRTLSETSFRGTNILFEAMRPLCHSSEVSILVIIVLSYLVPFFMIPTSFMGNVFPSNLGAWQRHLPFKFIPGTANFIIECEI